MTRHHLDAMHTRPESSERYEAVTDYWEAWVMHVIDHDEGRILATFHALADAERVADAMNAQAVSA